MTALAIADLNTARQLDRDAMHQLIGGWNFTGYSNFTSSSWSTVSDTTSAGGFQTIGTVRYRIVNRRIREERTQRRTKNYKRLEFAGYL